MALFVLPFAGVLMALILSDEMPDPTLLWAALFCIGLLILTISEIRRYLHIHSERYQQRIKEQEAMTDLLKSRLINSDKKAMNSSDETKLIDQMASELRARIGSSNSLSAANLKQLTSEMAAQMPRK